MASMAANDRNAALADRDPKAAARARGAAKPAHCATVLVRKSLDTFTPP
jgi:hypothetical protein